MMRSIQVLAVMVAFGAGSAMAATCYVKGDKGCASGSVVKVDGVKMCKVGAESPELAYFKSKSDCAGGKNASVASANGAAGRIRDTAEGESGPKRAGATTKNESPCSFMEPQSNGQELCTVGKVVAAKSIYENFDADAVPGTGRPGVCSGNGWVTSRFHATAGCKGEESYPSVCWVQKSGSTDCDSLRPGVLANTDEGIDLCKVGKGSGEMDFFFDNHCERGNLAWNSKKSGKIPDEKKAGETVKPIDEKFVKDPVRSDEPLSPKDVKAGSGG